jgi:myosin-1
MSRRKVTAIKKHVETRIAVGVEDMVLLPNLSESGIVDNLNSRLLASEIYSNIGHVLVACNPYKWLDIYDADWIKRYQHQQRVDVAPHVFATAEAAYRTMVTEEDSQCIIISGESGAGKTEASKHIQTYIAGVCGGGESVDKLKQVFLESNPVLEAFGNAKTLRNNNSSRFGKYFVLKFNRFGTPLGGSVTNYLLEKSRIVRPGKGERTFHIFYQLLRSEFCGALKLSGKGDDYQTLSCSGCLAVDGVDDAKEFKITLEAMRNVGISNKQIQSILSLVASILHIGNVGFQSKEIGDAEGSKIMNKEALLTFCDFCKVDEAKIAHVLIFREMQTAGPSGKTEVYQVPQNPVQAAARRDAIAKAIFEKLFDLIVERINVALAVNASGAVDEDDMVSIGVLDIYGFEIFEQNGFEQLCINYVNEKLQQIFIELTLRAEQDEYEREGIAWTPIPFFNNKIVCDLLDEARPAGVFRILDDVVKTLHGSQDMPAVDRKFLETATQVHGRHEHFKNVSGAFTIRHYAGDVVYTAKGGFVESNKDSLSPDLYAVLEASADKLVQRLFPPLPDVGSGKKAAVSSASSKIRTQCNALVSALMECQPHYVRCIKSNDQKKALSIDNRRVQHQVKYLGLLENIKVRRAGFAYRAEYHRFLSRFGILSTATYPEWTGSDKDGCRKIMAAIAKKIASIDREEVQLGKTKIFIRQPESYFAIERLREVRLGDFVAAIQRAWRRYKSSKEFITMQSSMAKWYADERKSRRRDSIFRPYAGDYLDALGARAEVVREGLFRIIDHYNVKENVLFADASCCQLRSISRTDLSRTVCDGCASEEKLVVLTDSALYLMDIVTEGYFAKYFPKEVMATKSLPAVVLRRRIRLHRSKGEGCLTGVSLSKLADPCVALLVRTESQLKPPRIDHFVPDSDPSAGKCAASGTVFSLFTRRHHCRLSGNCYTDAHTRYTQPLPDSGYYHEQRVADNFIGLESTDLVEDVLLVCARRTELVSILNQRWQILECGGSLPVKFSNTVKLTGGLTGDNGGGSHGFFSSAGALQQPSVLAAEIVFTEGVFASPPKQKRSARAAPVVGLTAAETLSQNFEVRVERDRQGKFLICSPAGLSHDVVLEKQKRAAKRQKAKLEKRKKLDAERQERAAVREAQRENERLVRLGEKKAQKAAEKAARKESEQQAVEAEGVRVLKQKPKAIVPEAKPVSGGANNELAAALARRKANA